MLLGWLWSSRLLLLLLLLLEVPPLWRPDSRTRDEAREVDGPVLDGWGEWVAPFCRAQSSRALAKLLVAEARENIAIRYCLAAARSLSYVSREFFMSALWVYNTSYHDNDGVCLFSTRLHTRMHTMLLQPHLRHFITDLPTHLVMTTTGPSSSSPHLTCEALVASVTLLLKLLALEVGDGGLVNPALMLARAT